MGEETLDNHDGPGDSPGPGTRRRGSETKMGRTWTISTTIPG